MHKGKLSEISYRRSVENKIPDRAEGIESGVDAAEMKLEDVTAVMSSNCILEYFQGAEEFYLQKTINCIYEKGGEPLYVQLLINIPGEDYPENSLSEIIKNIQRAVKAKKMEISQCRVYSSDIEKPLIHFTVIGRGRYDLSPHNMRAGMDVVMAGFTALGGAYVIAKNHKEMLKAKFPNFFVKDCMSMGEHLDMREAVMCAYQNNPVAIHNVSDGGIFGAVWELVSPTNLGITINIKDIPILQETVEVTEMFDINPYLLEGTGAVLIVSEDGKAMTDALEKAGIRASVIGSIMPGRDRIAVNGDEVRYLEPPRGDELYKII